MKKLLFIVPKLATGGANSSLDSLYPQLKDQFEIAVFSISHHPVSHNYSFCEVLLKKDYLLSLIYSNYADQEGFNKIAAFFVKVFRTSMRKLGVNIGLQRSKQVIKKLNSRYSFDYIVGYQEGNATLFASLFSNPNKIAWIHADYNEYLPFPKSEEHIYSQFKSIVSVSKYTTDVFAKRYPSLANRTLAINNLLDIPRILQMAEQPVDDERFITDKYTIISVGRFGTVKRFSKIPEIAAELRKRGIDFVWYVLGPRYEIEEVSAFQTNLALFGMQETVLWLGGKSNPYPYYRSANLYVCLSKTEACPMVFKEARFFGLPIVTTDFPSSYEFVQNNEGVITSMDGIVDAIKYMKERYDQGFRLQSGTDDSKVIVDIICSLFD